MKGNLQILSALLQRGAVVDKCHALVSLLGDPGKTRETKLAMCQELISRATTGDSDILEDLQDCLFVMISRNAIESCEIFLKAGMDPSFRNNGPLHFAIRKGNEPVCRLLVQYGADPFLEVDVHTPFQTAATKNETVILKYFMGLWDERFPSNHGKNDHDAYPINVICLLGGRVSLPAIQLLLAMDGHAVHALKKYAGLYPFQIATMADASVDVIYTLFQHCTDTFVREHLAC